MLSLTPLLEITAKTGYSKHAFSLKQEELNHPGLQNETKMPLLDLRSHLKR